MKLILCSCRSLQKARYPGNPLTVNFFYGKLSLFAFAHHFQRAILSVLQFLIYFPLNILLSILLCHQHRVWCIIDIFYVAIVSLCVKTVHLSILIFAFSILVFFFVLEIGMIIVNWWNSISFVWTDKEVWNLLIVFCGRMMDIPWYKITVAQFYNLYFRST